MVAFAQQSKDRAFGNSQHPGPASEERSTVRRAWSEEPRPRCCKRARHWSPVLPSTVSQSFQSAKRLGTSTDEARVRLIQGYVQVAATCTILVTAEPQEKGLSVEFQAYHWISCLCLEQNYICVTQCMGISSLRLYKCYLKRY